MVALVGEDDPREDSELRAFSNHAAGRIDEWKDPAEDDIWT